MSRPRSSVVLVSHDDGSTEFVTLQDTSSPLISTYDGRQGGDDSMIGPLEIETLPNTPSPVPSQAEDPMVRRVEVEVEELEELEEEEVEEVEELEELEEVEDRLFAVLESASEAP